MAQPALTFRSAREADLARIVGLLANDPLGAKREEAGEDVAESYGRAFAAIEADPGNEIILAERGESILGCLQLTFIPNLTYAGGERAQIEGVRVVESERGSGVGRRLVVHAIALARERGCVLVQLTSDKRRPAAIAFYEALGFTASHEGMKLWF